MGTLPTLGSPSTGSRSRVSPPRPSSPAPSSNRSRRWLLILLLLGVACLLVVLLWPRAEKKPAPVATPEPSVVVPEAQAPERSVEASEAASKPVVKIMEHFWKPGAPHHYGDAVDPFIRQPHDYPPNTPKILGGRISLNVFDLETVQDTVRSGQDPGSHMARALGRVLTEEEWLAGRQAIQSFFDEAVPHVDAIIAGTESREAGEAFFEPRRSRLNQELREALHMDEEEFNRVWPHVRKSEGAVKDFLEEGPRKQGAAPQSPRPQSPRPQSPRPQ
jgi:hypothetical protein